jgi:hypothetical protein
MNDGFSCRDARADGRDQEADIVCRR